MKLSVIVIFHNMAREARRTLYSLSPDYQRDLPPLPYEVLAIDNGSDLPLDAEEVRAHGAAFSYHRYDTAAASPVAAVNYGVRQAQGEWISVIVDGARMASPGLIGKALRAAALDPVPFLYCPSWHLGPDVQNRSILDGYDQTREDALLDGIGWPRNGYELFDISTLAQSSAGGFLGGLPAEFSWFMMPRSRFLEMGGFDPRFVSPGGGLVNHDFRDRALALGDMRPTVVLGEGVFHQFHGGIATNVPMERHPIRDFRQEYEEIHGYPYRPTPAMPAQVFGSLPEQTRRFLQPAGAP